MTNLPHMPGSLPGRIRNQPARLPRPLGGQVVAAGWQRATSAEFSPAGSPQAPALAAPEEPPMLLCRSCGAPLRGGVCISCGSAGGVDDEGNGCLTRGDRSDLAHLPAVLFQRDGRTHAREGHAPASREDFGRSYPSTGWGGAWCSGSSSSGHRSVPVAGDAGARARALAVRGRRARPGQLRAARAAGRDLT